MDIELVEMKFGVRVSAYARVRACFRPPKNIRIPRWDSHSGVVDEYVNFMGDYVVSAGK
jgi:hypothetical protein